MNEHEFVVRGLTFWVGTWKIDGLWTASYFLATSENCFGDWVNAYFYAPDTPVIERIFEVRRLFVFEYEALDEAENCVHKLIVGDLQGLHLLNR